MLNVYVNFGKWAKTCNNTSMVLLKNLMVNSKQYNTCKMI